MGKFSVTEIPLVLMVGQSNCGGHNDDGANATLTSYSNASIFYKPDWTSTNNGTWQSPIETGVNNAQYTRIDGGYDDIGMELMLSKLLYDHNGKHHYIIKLSYGGAEITDTIGQDDLNPINVGEYWTIAMQYTFQNAIEQLAGLGKVRGKVTTFQQGEAEGATSEVVANNYYQSGVTIDKDNPLAFLFQQLRAFHPLLNNVPIVITKVYTTSGGYPYTSNVATRQEAYVNDFSNVTLIDMDDDVTFSDGGVHWDAATQELKATNVYNVIKDY